MQHPWDPQQFARGARLAGRGEDVIQNALTTASEIKTAGTDLPVIFSLNHLCHLTGSHYPELREMVGRHIDPYRVFRLLKRSVPGKPAAARRYRTIAVPQPSLMRLQRWLSANILSQAKPHSASKAFHPGCTLKAAVEPHLNAVWVVKLDIHKFFDSINEVQVYWVFRRLGYRALLAFELARLCTRVEPRNGVTLLPSRGVRYYRTPEKGHLPQGAPSSPMLANLVAFHLDSELQQIATDLGYRYTRYADDLVFSTGRKSSRRDAMRLVQLAKSSVARHGYEPNRTKTQIVPPGARKVILGILVDRTKCHLTKQFRDNIETHLYALRHPQIGPEQHMRARGFVSTVGMRRHVLGLISYAKGIDPQYGERLQTAAKQVNWYS